MSIGSEADDAAEKSGGEPRGPLSGKVAVVTGGGQGLGRAHALALGLAGARVVVNDLDSARAEAIAAEIRSQGSGALASAGPIDDWDYAETLVRAAVDHFGRLDLLVNNAGVLRDQMIVNLDPASWDLVLSVHLRGTAAAMHHAASHWRARAKAGETVAASVVNTTSVAGLYGNIGQANYAAAKAGIAALTIVGAEELARYGVTVNAVSPSARTEMTREVFADMMATSEEGVFDAMDPSNVSALVVWLASEEARDVTGRVIWVAGGEIKLHLGWSDGPRVELGRRARFDELAGVIRGLIADAPSPMPVLGTAASGVLPSEKGTSAVAPVSHGESS